jgi:hypothetical protein
MDDRNEITTFVVPRRNDTYFHSRTSTPHRHYFGGSGRCSCGKHREPATVSEMSFSPAGTPQDHLALEL